MADFRRKAVSLMLVFCFLSQSLDIAACVNEEGRALLRIRERVEVDPFGALVNWDEDDIDPCSWFGIECSADGRVVSLDLTDLCLKGTLAPELGELANMKYIMLHNNSFSGGIPREIGNLQELEVLDLGHNNLSGRVPSELDGISSLQILVLRSNMFVGSLAPRLNELSISSELQVDRGFSSSTEGSMDKNATNGTIRRLMQLLNDDKGKHPKSEKNHTGAHLSPSPSPEPMNTQPHSNFEAPSLSPSGPPMGSPSPAASSPLNYHAPSLSTDPPTPGPSPSLTSISSEPHHNKNDNISPIVLIPSPAKHPSQAAADTQKKHAVLWIIYVPVAVGISFLLTMFAVYFLCCRANKVVTVRPWATGLSGQLQKAFITGVPSLRRSEIETACEDLSNIIGSLSDCMLYKGTLSSGVEIAVTSSLIQSAKGWSKQYEAQFRKKISTLSKVNHKNFVNLLGFCEENEPFTRMMVFEYAPNGTLFEHLHIKEAEHLNWTARLRIIMGLAYCLDHMHKLNPPIVLRNLDSSSIYLTDDYAAKVSDLGFWNEMKESKSTHEKSALLDGHLSEMEDIVYKFGILLLEIISGRLPFSEDDGLLVLWASSYLSGKRPLKEMVDQTLESFSADDVSALCELIRSCITPDPKDRPTMAEVTAKLRGITAMPPDGAVPKLSPLWWAELEIISSEAN